MNNDCSLCLLVSIAAHTTNAITQSSIFLRYSVYSQQISCIQSVSFSLFGKNCTTKSVWSNIQQWRKKKTLNSYSRFYLILCGYVNQIENKKWPLNKETKKEKEIWKEQKKVQKTLLCRWHSSELFNIWLSATMEKDLSNRLLFACNRLRCCWLGRRQQKFLLDSWQQRPRERKKTDEVTIN